MQNNSLGVVGAQLKAYTLNVHCFKDVLLIFW